MVASMPLTALSLISVLAIGVSTTAISGTAQWTDWTCPPPSTETLNVTQTQYVPVTSTETDIQTSVVTIYQTIVQTLVQTEQITQISPTTEVLPTTLVEVSSVFETVVSGTTQLQTIVATKTVTLTATEAVSIYSSTTRLTSLKLCSTRIANPTFTIQAPLPSDWTWGCPPGWLCKPQQIDCDFEVGLPDRGFYCSPNECIPAEALPNPLPTWNTDPSGNLSALTDPALSVTPLDSYFNMNPTDFGLTYEVFIIDKVETFTSTYLIPPAPSVAARSLRAPYRRPYRRQFQTVVPAACYDWCNNVLLEAQSEGKSPALCRPDSAFETSLLGCLKCIALHPKETVETVLGLDQIAPQFQQFMDYCNQTAGIVSGTATVVSATPGGSTTTTIVPTTSPTTEKTITTSPLATPDSSIAASTPETSTPGSASKSSLPASTTAAATSAESGRGSETVVPHTTTATLPTTITTVGGGSTLTGSQLSSLTILVIGPNNSTTTMSGPDLSGATIILAGNTTSTITSSYVTTITTSEPAAVPASESPASSPAPSTPVSGTPSSSAGPGSFTGAASSIIPRYSLSWLATLFAWSLTLI